MKPVTHDQAKLAVLMTTSNDAEDRRVARLDLDAYISQQEALASRPTGSAGLFTTATGPACERCGSPVLGDGSYGNCRQPPESSTRGCGGTKVRGGKAGGPRCFGCPDCQPRPTRECETCGGAKVVRSFHHAAIACPDCTPREPIR